MEARHIRLLGITGGDEISICPHLKLDAVEVSEQEGCEYWEQLSLCCFECGDFSFWIHVN